MTSRKQPAQCPSCHEHEIRLRRFYRGPVQIVEGPRAGRYVVDCGACGLVGTVSAEDRHLLPLGRGTGIAVPLTPQVPAMPTRTYGPRLYMGR